MARYLVGLWVAATFFVGLGGLPGARAGWVWQQAGPTGTSRGLSAVAVDPEDPRVVYFAGGSTVWVSDDGGDSFQLVVGLGRSLKRRQVAGDEEFGDDEGASEENATSTDALLEWGARESSNLLTDGPRESSRTKADGVPEALRRASITRLRIIGSRVYVCGARGLSSFDRRARSFTSVRAEWMGRKDPVLDVAAREGGGLWLATTEGLVEVTPEGVSRPVQGGLGQESVGRILRGLVASQTGLWSQGPGGFQRLRPFARRLAVDDMLVQGGTVWVLRGGQLLRFDATQYRLLEVQSVPGARRLAVGRQGEVWIVTDAGLWERSESGAIARVGRELRDPNLSDIVAVPTGPYPMWVVGRGGAWRLTTEVARIMSERGRTINSALEGLPSVMAVLSEAARQHGVHADQLDAWRGRLATAWLLPRVDLDYSSKRRRVEWHSFVPALEGHVTDEVRVLPVDDEFRIMAHWEFLPPLMALLDRGGLDGSDGFRDEVTRSVDRVEQVRRRVGPVYAAWLRAVVRHRTMRPANARQALADRLALAQLHADLAALTGGWFKQFDVLKKGVR